MSLSPEAQANIIENMIQDLFLRYVIPDIKEQIADQLDNSVYRVLNAQRRGKTFMHPATEAILKHFQYGHLPANLQAISKPICDLARDMAEKLPDGPEKTAGLRKLLEAKDCFVRTMVED